MKSLTCDMYDNVCKWGKSRREDTRRGGENHLSGLIQRGAQWHFGVIHISARLGPNESKQPLF